MAFKLDLSDTYKYPVKFTVMSASGNQQNHEIKLIFKRLTREQLVEIQNITSENTDATPAEVVEEDLDYLLGFTTGWDGVDIGGDTEFNRDNLRTLINSVPRMSRLIVDALLESAMGGEQKKTR